MRAATVIEIKKELKNRSSEEQVELCLQLAKFKKENKELLTYLLYEASDEGSYIQGVKDEVDDEFEMVNRSSYYYVKKSARKILRLIKKYIRFSKRKETEVELLIYYCKKLKEFAPEMDRSVALSNLYHRQWDLIKKSISTLHEDLQYDYLMELDLLK